MVMRNASLLSCSWCVLTVSYSDHFFRCLKNLLEGSSSAKCTDDRQSQPRHCGHAAPNLTPGSSCTALQFSFSSNGIPVRLLLGLFARWWGRMHICSGRHQIWLPLNGWFEQHGDSWRNLVLASQERHAECSRRACSHCDLDTTALALQDVVLRVPRKLGREDVSDSAHPLCATRLSNSTQAWKSPDGPQRNAAGQPPTLECCPEVLLDSTRLLSNSTYMKPRREI